MNEPTDRTLEEAAEAVADERPLDWGSAAARNPELGKTLEELRRLESLARAHREARAEAASGAEPRAAEAPAAFTWGTLRVREKLGEGGFGEVWLAFDSALGREVALKLRRETGTSGTRRWLDEGRRLARVRHPNVLTVFGAAEHNDRAGIWTELVRGETLEQRLTREGRLGAREAALAGAELCAALSAVHAAGVVHGDLTAANVMREGHGSAGPGRLVLMDFGSGHEIDGADAIARGTPLACAPEVLRGEAATPRSDLYSLGALLFRLLTGRYPVEGATLEELSRRHAQGGRPSLRALRPDLPGELCAAVEKALEADPARRFNDAGEFERALTATLGAGRDGAVRATPLLLAAAAVGALVIGVVLVQRMRPKPAVPQPVAIHPAPAPAPEGAARTEPVPAPPLVVDAQLVRRSDGGSESLSDGARVGVGDRLALEVRCAEPAWVYVLNEDQSGHAFALFPLSGLELTNPLQANQRHRLPGALHGKPFAWQVTTNGGEERFLVVVSRHRLSLVETQLAALEGARAPDGNEPLAGNVDTPRGVGAMVEDVPDAASSAGGPLERLAKRLEGSGDAGVWVRVLRLEHPSP